MAEDEVELALPAYFVHVSDLHFSLVDPRQLLARAQPVWGRVPLLDRLLGHDLKAADKLDEFLRDLRTFQVNQGLRGNAHLIVTGDVTGVGAASEFACAHEYLTHRHDFGDGYLLGLDSPQWSDRGVSGNHDRWSGLPAIFGTTAPWAGHGCFPHQFPFLSRRYMVPGFPPIRFVGIDSDHNVASVGWKRLTATGAFTDQIVYARRQLEHAKEPEIRIAVIHHSRLNAFGRTNGISSRSRLELDAFLGEFDIRVMLTGHVHAPQIRQPVLSGRGANHTVMEARSGTTTQICNKPVRAYLDLNWVPNALQRIARQAKRSNSLLVHRLEREGNTLQWHSQAFGLMLDGGTGARAFQPLDVPAPRHADLWTL